MNDKRASQLVEPNSEVAFDEQLKSKLVNLHTLLPGVIHSFDPVKQTAQVQPCIKRIFIDKGPVNLPMCVDVPVEFPGGGGYFLTFPVKAGDECVLAFSERAIDFWYQNGGIQLPSEYRLHDLSDAIARVGLNSQPNKITSFNVTGTELRNRSRTMRVTMGDNNTIENVVPGGSTLLANGTFTINANLVINGTTNSTGQIIGAGINLTTHRHTGVQTGGGNTGGAIA